MKRFAVIVHHNRHEWCHNLIKQLTAQDTCVVVVDNNSEPPLNYPPDHHLEIVMIFHFEPEPFNLSTLWNVGLDFAERIHIARGGGEWIVGVFNDDVSLPSNFMEKAEEAILRHGVTVAFPDHSGRGNDVVCKDRPGTTYDLGVRMAGFANVWYGPDGFRCDEDFPVWYADDDAWMLARLLNGSVLMGGVTVDHLDANGNFSRNPEWQTQAAIDRGTFERKWGFAPWVV